jgi:hypothetical protein
MTCASECRSHLPCDDRSLPWLFFPLPVWLRRVLAASSPLIVFATLHFLEIPHSSRMSAIERAGCSMRPSPEAPCLSVETRRYAAKVASAFGRKIQKFPPENGAHAPRRVECLPHVPGDRQHHIGRLLSLRGA